MFQITVKGDSLQDLAANLTTMVAQFQTTVPEGERRAITKRATPKAKPIPTDDEPVAQDEVDRELLEEVPPAPATANAVVDAGTGQPVAAAAETKQMTIEDVRKAAGQLAAKDTPALKALLEKYGAPNLSGVPNEKLGDFASDVLEALG